MASCLCLRFCVLFEFECVFVLLKFGTLLLFFQIFFLQYVFIRFALFSFQIYALYFFEIVQFIFRCCYREIAVGNDGHIRTKTKPEEEKKCLHHKVSVSVSDVFFFVCNILMFSPKYKLHHFVRFVLWTTAISAIKPLFFFLQWLSIY